MTEEPVKILLTQLVRCGEAYVPRCYLTAFTAACCRNSLTTTPGAVDGNGQFVYNGVLF